MCPIVQLREFAVLPNKKIKNLIAQTIDERSVDRYELDLDQMKQKLLDY